MPTLVNNSTKREADCRLATRDGVPVLEETYHFLVKADYIGQPNIEILQTSGLPIIGGTISSGGAICKSVQATRRTEASLYYDVVAEFSSEVDEDQGEGDPNTDPTAWIPIYETKFERLVETVAEDQSGNAIANSAGQAFEQGLQIARFIPVWEFYQFEPATVTDETIIERNEVVNSASFKGRAAKTLLCTVMSSVIGFFYGQRRRLTQYSLKYNEKDWTHKRLDVGTQYKDGAQLKTFTDSDDQVMLGSLDGSGGKQAAGTAPATLDFDVYATNDFSFLRI